MLDVFNTIFLIAASTALIGGVLVSGKRHYAGTCELQTTKKFTGSIGEMKCETTEAIKVLEGKVDHVKAELALFHVNQSFHLIAWRDKIDKPAVDGFTPTEMYGGVKAPYKPKRNHNLPGIWKLVGTDKSLGFAIEHVQFYEGEMEDPYVEGEVILKFIDENGKYRYKGDKPVFLFKFPLTTTTTTTTTTPKPNPTSAATTTRRIARQQQDNIKTTTTNDQNGKTTPNPPPPEDPYAAKTTTPATPETTTESANGEESTPSPLPSPPPATVEPEPSQSPPPPPSTQPTEPSRASGEKTEKSIVEKKTGSGGGGGGGGVVVDGADFDGTVNFNVKNNLHVVTDY